MLDHNDLELLTYDISVRQSINLKLMEKIEMFKFNWKSHIFIILGMMSKHCENLFNEWTDGEWNNKGKCLAVEKVSFFGHRFSQLEYFWALNISMDKAIE